MPPKPRTRVLLPTHLFATRPAERDCVIALDPVFFTGPDGTFRIHKGKLAYMVAAAEAYAALHGFAIMYPDEVVYPRGAVAYEPMDRFVEAKLRAAGVAISGGFPGFALDPRAYAGPARLVSVYAAARRATGILEDAPSMDRFNRARPTRELAATVAAARAAPRRATPPAMRRAIAFVESRFPDHYGDAAACAYFPSTRRAALARVRAYVRRGLRLMRFQDAMVAGEPFLAHSALSAALNLGLVSPAEVCRAVAAADAPLAAREGFVRQVLGWRELMAVVAVRGLAGPVAFGAVRPAWYSGSTGLAPVDDCVRRALATGYLHHIERLMVVLNAMTLVGLGEGAIYRWFMEVVAMDAFDWVMVGNVGVMGGFAAGVARKPYVSGSAYLARMSTGHGDAWRDDWDSLFYAAVPRFPYFRAVARGKRFRSRDWAARAEPIVARLK